MTNKWCLYAAIVVLMSTSIDFADQQPSRIDIPVPPPDTTSSSMDSPALQDASTDTVSTDEDGTSAVKEWKIYSNGVIGFKTRVKSAWTVTEFKDAKNSSFAAFTISRPPANLVTFSVNRDPLDRSFDEWTSTTSLSQLYPSGFKKSRMEFAGRPSVMIQGLVSDGRMDRSYFTQEGAMVCQVSFTAPPQAWTDPTDLSFFDELKKNFQWLR